MPVRLRVLLAGMAIPLALWLATPVILHARSLDDRIADKRSRVERERGRANRLAGQVAAFSRRIGRLQTRISGLQETQDSLQADLDSKLAELASIQEDLRTQRARLVNLRTRLVRSRQVLAARLVELYKSDKPDVMTVILESNGFADLLERGEFLARVSHQDRRIIQAVATNKAETAATTKRLAGLERRQRVVAAVVASRRNEVNALREQVVSRRDSVAAARSQRQGVLSDTRDQLSEDEGDLQALEAQNARITAQIQGMTGGSAGPIRRGASGLIWPISGPVTSPFGMRWGRLHAGIDIAAPVGTPIRAADSGRVIIAGWTGGYGNYTCIQHGGPISTCYGHQSAIGVSVGQAVSQGQVIGQTGNTGNSTGPHLHFEVRINGNPVDPMGYL